MSELSTLQDAVSTIKHAILQSQYRAAKLITGEQLSLYFGIGCYVSTRSRKETWGTGVINRISEQLRRELPGLRGFSASSIKNMRLFYEYWASFLIRQPVAGEFQALDNEQLIKIDNLSLQNWQPLTAQINREEFLSVSFSHHIEILSKTREVDERDINSSDTQSKPPFD